MALLLAGCEDITLERGLDLDRELFPLVETGEREAPENVDYRVLQLNAWNDLEIWFDDTPEDYESWDPNWAIGTDGPAKPDGGFEEGHEYTVTVDANPDDDGDDNGEEDGEADWDPDTIEVRVRSVKVINPPEDGEYDDSGDKEADFSGLLSAERVD